MEEKVFSLALPLGLAFIALVVLFDIVTRVSHFRTRIPVEDKQNLDLVRLITRERKLKLLYNNLLLPKFFIVLSILSGGAIFLDGKRFVFMITIVFVISTLYILSKRKYKIRDWSDGDEIIHKTNKNHRLFMVFCVVAVLIFVSCVFFVLEDLFSRLPKSSPIVMLIGYLIFCLTVYCYFQKKRDYIEDQILNSI